MPDRCKNCRRYNTLRLQATTRKRNNTSIDLCDDDIEKYSYTCSKSDCRTHFSPRTSTFFGINNAMGTNISKLAVSQLFELIYLWCIEEQRCRVVALTQITEKTVTFWYSALRNICYKMFQRREKMGGENRIVEIDECLLRGRRKNNRGRFLSMDRWLATPNYFLRSRLFRGATPLRRQRRNERYGYRINGPWVVGICECSVDEDGKRKLLESRFFIVQKGDKRTLTQLVLQEVENGSTIYTDEWLGYTSLRIYGYNHITVNHSKEYVTPEGYHTNTVEVVWHHLKTKLIRKMSGVPRNQLDSYLHES